VPSNPETTAAFADPRPGDRFHEMFSYWMTVVHVRGGAVFTTDTSTGFASWASAEELSKAFQYGCIEGWYVRFDRNVPRLGMSDGEFDDWAEAWRACGRDPLSAEE
jgi:hypothetical protein